MNDNDINTYLPSILNPRTVRRQHGNLTLTQNSIVSRCSLSLKRNGISKYKNNINKTFPVPIDKENSENTQNFTLATNKDVPNKNPSEEENMSAIEDLIIVDSSNLSPFIFEDTKLTNDNKSVVEYKESTLAMSSTTDLYDYEHYLLDTDCDNKIPVFSVSFGVTECENVNISTKNSNIKKILVSRKNNNDITLDCELVEATQIHVEKDIDENILPSPPKRLAVDVNLEIQKENLSTSEDAAEKSKVLILKTDAIEKLSHVIVQPPNYNLVKRQNSNKSKLKSSTKKKTIFKSDVKNGNSSVRRGNLRQSSIADYLSRGSNVLNFSKVSQERVILKLSNSNVYNGCLIEKQVQDDAQDMSKNSGVADIKCERLGRSHNTGRRDNEASPRSIRISSSKRENLSPRRDIKTSCSDAPRTLSPKSKNDSVSSHSPRKNVESIQFNLPTKSKSNKTSVATKIIPHYKIVAGTHFAVDAFSYGDIPNVKHYFLTHFHSDHYSGLKRTFNKLLFCSKITADLCVSRLGVNPKCIHIINLDETIRVEGVEVTSIDANHCPGAIMLVFTLPNGKTILHTGDFRASPAMESYPVFWNKDIHTVYLDTTYCNPRYDFPTQDQSLEMALFQLRQKKMTLEKTGKKFSSVLIVCGTYTIGKEKFFLGMARRVGCSVWACPEKDRVLQAVEGRSFSHAPPSSCQLHVVPMRDLTHEKLRSYLDSLQGAFNEVVAFKPSGWENGKNSSVEKDLITIHGIPYSEHSSFSEMIRFVKYLKPKQVVPTVDISGGIKAVQKYFPCPLVYKEDVQSQSKVTDYFSIQNRQQVPAVT